jgi:hypothetical protein
MLNSKKSLCAARTVDGIYSIGGQLLSERPSGVEHDVGFQRLSTIMLLTHLQLPT